MRKKHRIFIAINVPEEMRRFFDSFQKKWPDLPTKWVSQDNLHITLVFLGYLTNEELGAVCMAVKEVAARHRSFNVSLSRISYGPPGKIPPRMIWAGGEKVKELSELKRDLEESLAEVVRFPQDGKSFSPHVTLARVKALPWRAIEPEERPEINENINLNFTVESIEIMESILKRTDPEYSVIESFSLGLNYDTI